MMFKNLRDKNNKMWSKFYDPNTKISAKAKWYVIAPLVLILVGVVFICIPNVGFNLGLDFTGGSVIEATNFSSEADVPTAKGAVEGYLKSKGIKYDISTPRNNTTGLGLSIKYQAKRGLDMDKVGDEIGEKITGVTNASGNSVTIKNSESISASASGERIMMTFISIAVTLIAILIYILFRFKLTSGIAAMVALLHDVLVVCALTAIFRV
ncbi:MAG: hypothetical protein LBG88_00170, partial [Christensenellaceae bacterium]|nr:hypothetical protein [Christensenellaceae bacterium]